MSCSLLFLLPLSISIEIGQIPPDFALKDERKKTTRFSDLLGNRPLVIFFYPKDSSQLGKQFLKSFQQYAKKFNSKNATVIGINQNSASTHRNTISNLSLSFSLLSDKRKSVQRAWQLPTSFFLSPCVTCVFTTNGTLLWMYHSRLFPYRHAQKAYHIVSRLAPEQPTRPLNNIVPYKTNSTIIAPEIQSSATSFLPLQDTPSALPMDSSDILLFFRGLRESECGTQSMEQPDANEKVALASLIASIIEEGEEEEEEEEEEEAEDEEDEDTADNQQAEDDCDNHRTLLQSKSHYDSIFHTDDSDEESEISSALTHLASLSETEEFVLPSLDELPTSHSVNLHPPLFHLTAEELRVLFTF